MKSFIILLLFSLTAMSQNTDATTQTTSTKVETVLKTSAVERTVYSLTNIENAEMTPKNNNSSQEPELELMSETKIETLQKEKEFSARPELRMIVIDSITTESED
ncbi:MAG: hypothetical protein Q8O62_10685 [Aequorivita sp.]|nr:hypothetical protein [Aequorivita sp.]